MITIKIGTEQKQIDDVDPQWINQQINRRRENGASVCVRVFVRLSGLNMILSTPNCEMGGSGRAPARREREIFDLWGQRGLNRADFSGGNLVAFLEQLKRLL